MVRERDGGGAVVIFKNGPVRSPGPAPGSQGLIRAVEACSGRRRVPPAAFPWLLMRDPGKIYTHTTG